MSPAFAVVLVLLVCVAAYFLTEGWRARRLRNALELSTKQANDAFARVTLLDAERRLLEAALERRDASLADVSRELDALRAVLREEEAPVGDVRRRLAAFSALEDLVRLG